MRSLTSVIPSGDGPVAAIVAHPDDETFGLGALLADLARAGRAARVLCFTHGEASTIGAAAELGRTRRREFLDAAEVLGVADTTLLDLPDGGLEARPVGDLDAIIDTWLDVITALIVFEPHGVTGHPDHRAVTAAAERVADRRALPVVEWGLHPATSSRLRTQHGLRFHTVDDGPGVFDVDVDRATQLTAIRCHASQLDDDPVVFKRLAVQGDVERVRIRTPPTPNAEGDLMDRHDWDARYGGEQLVWSAEPNRFLVAEVDGLTPGRALDVACGEGRNAIWLAERGWTVTGVDFSPVALDKARAQAAARHVSVNWELADVTDSELIRGQFDLVIVMYLHLPERSRRLVFGRAAAAVAPGGTVLVVGHDTTNPELGWGGPQDHAVLYGPDDVAADLDGLDLVKATRVERPVPTDDGDRIAIDTLVRATRPLRSDP